MAFSKAHLYPEPLRKPAFYAKSLCHPERFFILHFLNTHGPSNVMDITRHSYLSQPVVSQHLAILRRAGLVTFKEKTPFIEYALEVKTVEVACTSILGGLSDLFI